MAIQPTNPLPKDDALTRYELHEIRATAAEPQPDWTTPDQGPPPAPLVLDDVVLVLAVPAATFDRLERDAADQELDVHRWARLLLRAASVATSSTDR
jgi:hypothetical protein